MTEPSGASANRWGHPFEPYQIQEEFMRESFDVLQRGGIGIFESPTGTGKSLSLICSSFTWLQAHLKGELEDAPTPAAAAAPASAEPDWIESATRDLKRQSQVEEFALATQQRQKRLKRMQAGQQSLGSGRRARALDPVPRAPGPEPPREADPDDDAAFAGFLVRDDSGEGGEARASAAVPFDASDDERDPAASASASAGSWREKDPLEVKPSVQILYCSRTHSQLAQFVGEVRRTPHAAQMSVVSLGSRKQLCIHAPVASLGSSQRINDGCQALQRAKGKGAGCPFLRGSTDEAQRLMRDSLLVRPTDVEELVSLGRALGCCPYFASRGAAPSAHVLVVPYSCLLHEPTRSALGLRLESSVVLMDEAHNLLDAINDVHSVALTASQLGASHAQLSRYLNKYQAKLSPANRVSLTALIRLVKALRSALVPKPAPAAAAAVAGTATAAAATATASASVPPAASEPCCSVHRVNELLSDLGVDHLNLWSLAAFCARTELARKVQGFIDALDAADAASVGRVACLARGTPSVGAHAGATYAVVSMLHALTAADADGRVLIARGSPSDPAGAQAQLKFLHLNPVVHFAPIVKRARALVLTGGTMEPIDELLEAVRAGDEHGDRLRVRRFGHVVPAANLLGACVRAASAGDPPLQLVASTRARHDVLDAVGRALGELRRATRGGLVVFFPSFAYAALAKARWTATGALSRELGAAQTEGSSAATAGAGGGAPMGALFDEPREASEVEAMLEAYARAIRPEEGGATPGRVRDATLLSVVGGKMSEGINFADDMGRTVVVVGLPYPNPQDPELVERMAFLNAREAAATASHTTQRPASADGRTAGQRYYEGLCMRAVNQSIGRVIRHRADYASIVLLDARYMHSRVQAKLPGWIRSSVRNFDSSSAAASEMATFFAGHRATAAAASGE